MNDNNDIYMSPKQERNLIFSQTPSQFENKRVSDSIQGTMPTRSYDQRNALKDQVKKNRTYHMI